MGRRGGRRIETMGELVRLRRETPWRTQRRTAYLVGLACTGLAALLGGMLALRWPQATVSDRWWVGLLVAVFGAVGLLALYTAFHQSLASLLGKLIVEADRRRIVRGEAVTIRFRQPGPVVLRSLRATLVRKTIVSPTEEQRLRSEDPRDSDDYEFYETFLDARGLSAPRGGMAEAVATLTIPPDARPSGRYGLERVRWLIEVWGRVRFWPGFMHQFEIVVTASPRSR